MKILLVDDNEDSLILMEYALRKDGYEIFLARNGQEALEITDKQSPDLILLDVMMPKMDGFVTCKKIHFGEKNKNIPIIMVTAKNDIGDLIRGLECGAIDYIKKPFHNLELGARVKSALKLKEATDELVKERQKTTLMEMAATVAHNLNQPLASIVLNIQYIQSLLNEDDELYNKLKEKIETLITLTDIMSEMIKKIGQITKYQTMPYIKERFFYIVNRTTF
jgi:DNA-binding response OmpR family regulator